MPELPEVETVVRTLRSSIQHSHILDVKKHHAGPTFINKSLPLKNLLDQTIYDVQRRGKLIIITLVKSETEPLEKLFLMVHLGMTGALLVKENDSQANTHSKFSLDLETTNKEQFKLFFDDIRGFGKVYISLEKNLDLWPFWKKLGPEPLSLNILDFKKLLAKKPHKNIKAFLLDQEMVAGLGNIYADESLFAAKISPLRKVETLKPEEEENLLKAIQEILRKSIEQCGTSFRNYRDAHGKAGAFQNYLAVYGKANTPCPNCGQKLEKITIAGRGTVICSRCQK